MKRILHAIGYLCLKMVRNIDEKLPLFHSKSLPLAYLEEQTTKDYRLLYYTNKKTSLGQRLGIANFHVCRMLRSAPHPPWGLATILACCMAMLWLSPAQAQTDETNTIKPLQIGDTIPEYLWHLPLQVVNHPEGRDTITLSDYRGKLIILDFWATWCAPCVAMMPKMDSLQRAFEGQLQVIAVTYQPDSVAGVFIERIQRQRGAAYRFNHVMADTLFSKYFNHNSIPHYVWLKVDTQGATTVQAITSANEVTATNIMRILADGHIQLATKEDSPHYDYDRHQPLFFTQPTAGPDGPLIMQTVFTPYKVGLGSGYHQTLVGVQDSLPYRRITFRNLYMVRMYQLIADDFRPLGWNRTILKVKDPDELIKWARGQEYTDWLRDHGFCYELIIPNQMAQQTTAIIRQHLDAYFTAYRVEVEEHERDCLVLHRTSNQEKFKSVGGAPSADFGFDGCTITNRRGGLRIFANALGLKHLYHLDTPVIDETDYREAVDLVIDAPLNDVEAINRELEKYDLALTIRPRHIKVLVVYDNDKQL